MHDVDRFATLYSGRSDAYGAESGGCVHKRVTKNTWHRHLTGMAPIGIYPLVDGEVHWGATDLDSGYDAIDQAINIYNALRHLGLHPIVELSRSKGFHVWLHLSPGQWVASGTMRRAFLVAHQLAEVKPREVNPKSTSGGATGIGNYVRLPYPAHGVWGKQIALDMSHPQKAPFTFRQFLDHAEQCAASNSVARLEAAALLYVAEPDAVVQSFDRVPAADAAVLAQRLASHRSRQLFHDGPSPDDRGHVDRSQGLYHLALAGASSGLSPGEIYAVIEDLDNRLGKYRDRHDREHQLSLIVQRATSYVSTHQAVQ